MSPRPLTRAGVIALVRDAEGTVTLKFDADELNGVAKRLRRVQGQIGGIVRMIEEGRDCPDIVTQLAAASKALDRAGFAMIAMGLEHCLIDDPTGASIDASSLKKLFLSLA